MNFNKIRITLYLIAALLAVVSYLLFGENLHEIEKKEIAPIQEVEEVKEVKKEPTAPITVAQKKQNYLDMIVPALNRVYDEELELFLKTKELIAKYPNDSSLQALKDKYNAKTDTELLQALKPHPKSVTIAQGAIESAWGTSRFFKEANNIFGVWSFNKDEPRIAASEQRGTKTIWLKKYATVEDAIRDYYLQMSRSWAFKKFRELNYTVENQNPYLLVKTLDRYSEKKELYGRELASMISFNNLTRFDPIQYKREKK